ncbi:hypothetical protein QFZ29_001166 [Agromyces albus]|nr:hypothetical protein [Agromyces albus]
MAGFLLDAGYGASQGGSAPLWTLGLLRFRARDLVQD